MYIWYVHIWLNDSNETVTFTGNVISDTPSLPAVHCFDPT